MSIADKPVATRASSSLAPHARSTLFLGRIVLAVLAMGWAFFILRQIVHFGVNVPFWDQWDYVSDYQRYEKGEIQFSSFLLAGAGEHLSVVQNGCSILLWRLTGMNLRLIMLLDWLLAVGVIILMALIAGRPLPRGSLMPWAILGISSFFVFNPAAFQLWMWGIPHHYTIVAFLFLAAAFCAQLRLPVGVTILIAAFAATLASLTLGSGMLLWGLLPIVLATCTSWRKLLRRRIPTAIYCSMGLLMVILYIHNLLNYHDPAPAAKAPTTLADLISFFLAYTGNLVSIFPVPDLVSWAHVIGALLIALLTVSSVAAIKTCRGKPEWSSTVIWLCFAAYQIVGGGLVTLTRHTFGVAYPVMGASRYVLATSFLPVAIIALGAVAMRALRSRLPVGLTWYSSLLCAVTAVLAICLVIRAGQIPGSLAAFSDSHRLEMNGKVAMAAANMMNLQAYRNIYPRDDWKDFQGLSAFITPRAEFPPMWDSNFVMRLAGAVANQQNFAGFVDTFAVRDGKLSLSGWAYLKAQQKPADAVITLAVPPSGKATLINVAFLSQRRPDVSKSMGNPEAMDTGWATEIAAPLPNTGSIIRSFAYDADTGQAYLLVGEGVL